MTLHPAVQAYRAGRFLDATELLRAIEPSEPAEFVLRVETIYQRGFGAQAAEEAKQYLRRDPEPILTSRCLSVIAGHLWDEGRMEEALAASRKAADSAEKSGNLEQIARANAQLLERACDTERFATDLPLALHVRRCAIRCGDPVLTAHVHLTFGRLEARAGRLDAARRHFGLSRAVTASEENLFVSASADLGDSVVLGTIGDLQGSFDLAARGAAFATTGGWSRGRVAAAANLAYLSIAMGEPQEAEKQLAIVSKEPFQSGSVRTAIADTRALSSLLRGDYQAGEDLIRGTERVKGHQLWYELKTQYTMIRLLSRQRKWQEALERAESCLTRFSAGASEDLAILFRVSKVNATMQLNKPVIAKELPLLQDGTSLGSLSTLYSAIAQASGAHAGRSRAWFGRARRVCQAVGSVEAESDVLDAMRLSAEPTSGSTEPPPPNLDSAVTLLDLAGHPHVLGREALAVIEGAACADAVALVATGAGAPRLLDGRGWSEADAVRALESRPEGVEILPVGRYRDEAWHLVVRPKPAIDPYCTFAAIRKLLAAAVSLDQYRRDEKQRTALWPAEALDGDPDSVWASEPMAEIVGIARRIAPTPLSVLLTGETGTGKEMLARAIHRASGRASKPFLPFNCTAVPRDMLESQLFGYRKGSFTGADASFGGIIRAAAGGTLFLDEIADVSLDVQPKLLRFLETHEVHPLGEPHPVTVDVRVIAATNASLEKLVADGRFREDLFYRLNVVRLKLPPLRERREEIPPLVYHYLRRFADEQRKGRMTLSDETLEYLLLFSWPGNVRQLANEMQRIVAMAEPDATITPAMLSPDIQASRRTIPAPPGGDAEVRLALDQPLPAAVHTLEQLMVRRALDRSHGRVEEASKMLGISRKGLFLKRRRLGLRQAS